jgi:hypothetical protein
MSDGPAELSERVVTPDVVDLLVDDARRLAQAAGVVLAQPDPDGPPLAALTWQLPVTVTSQDPPPGTVVDQWESVVVTWSPDEGGVHEPRGPAPRSMSGAREADDLEGPPERP